MWVTSLFQMQCVIGPQSLTILIISYSFFCFSYNFLLKNSFLRSVTPMDNTLSQLSSSVQKKECRKEKPMKMENNWWDDRQLRTFSI